MTSENSKESILKIITDREDELFAHFVEARNKEMNDEIIAEAWHDFQIVASLITELKIER